MTKNYQPAGRISFSFCPVQHRQAQFHPMLRHVPSLWTTDRETGSCQATASSPKAICSAATTILRDSVHVRRETAVFQWPDARLSCCQHRHPDSYETLDWLKSTGGKKIKRPSLTLAFPGQNWDANLLGQWLAKICVVLNGVHISLARRVVFRAWLSRH